MYVRVRAHGGVTMVCQYVRVGVCGGVCDYGVSVCVHTTVVCMCVSASDGARVMGVWVCVCEGAGVHAACLP